MKNKASIDIGSNSVLLLIENDLEEKLYEESNVTGLGRNIDLTKKFIDEAMEETFHVLKKYVEICQNYHIAPQDIICTATEAARVVQNSKDYFKKIYQELKLKTIIIDSQYEAFLSCKGILRGNVGNDPKLSILDIGGASSEIIQVNQNPFRIISNFSLPIGSVRYKNFVEQNIINEKLKEIEKQFHDQLQNSTSEKIYCVAGTMTSVANIYLGHKEFKEKDIDQLSFSLEDLKNIDQKIQNLPIEEINLLFPFLGKRSQTIKFGTKLAIFILEKIKCKNIVISTGGLRNGSIKWGIDPNHVIYDPSQNEINEL